MQNPLVEFVDLKKYFVTGRNSVLHAVDGLNAKISVGKTLGVVGESGCGKSTLGRTLLRLLEPTAGQILFEGVDIAKLKQNKIKKYRQEMQIIFQDPYSSLNPRKTVFETIATPLIVNKNYKNKADLERKVKEQMEKVGIASRLIGTYPHELDGGRRQRICIARALIVNPKFIVCDEPVSALDVSIQAQILNLLMDLQEEMGLTYLFITHDLSVVKHISDDVMVMYMGKCVEMADKRELFANPLHPYTKALLAAIPIPTYEARHKKIEIIKGEVSSPINPKPGCRFVPRCTMAKAECRQEDFELKAVSENHYVACPFI